LTLATPPESTIQPTSDSDVAAHYHGMLTCHLRASDALAGQGTVVLRLLAAVGLGLVILTVKSLRGGGTAWLFLVAFAAVCILVWYLLRQQSRTAQNQRIVAFYRRAIQRIDGTQPQSGRTGLEDGQSLRPEGHLYERDLDLLGPDSLFGLLATVRTGPGERGLARYLLEPASHQETLLRQQAVRELVPRTALREKIAFLGTTRFQQISASFFDEWLDETAPTFHPAFRVVLIVTALLNIVLLFAGFTHLRTWADTFPELALTLAVQAGISVYLRPRVMPLLQGGARLEQNVRLFADGLALMQQSDFIAPKLQALKSEALQPSGAVKLLKSLTSSLSIVEQRTKEYFLILSLLTAAGTQAAISLARWKNQYAPAMRQWLAAWAEFEALNAIATYAFEHPHDVWPDLLPPDHSPTFEALCLGHPLLSNAVPNDVSLGTDPRFFLISGSNMSGKSTLLRSIGINAVLAYAGAPVRATSLHLTPLRLGASLALTDSLAEGRSKFRAEVERLSAVVNVSATHPVLFLIDEIFSGTNSADRRTAAEAVLDRLLDNAAIGALSTHDLALTELANADNTGLNVHMASPNPDDPLAFDYKLKPGVNTTSNALAIVRMLGL
jgi:hypothetical protein